MIHALKSNTDRFHPVWDNVKNFEVRLDDRNYVVGDLLLMCEYDDKLDCFSGNFVLSEITYIYDGKGQSFPSGLAEGYVVLGTRFMARGTSANVHDATDVLPTIEGILQALEKEGSL